MRRLCTSVHNAGRSRRGNPLAEKWLFSQPNCGTQIGYAQSGKSDAFSASCRFRCGWPRPDGLVCVISALDERFERGPAHIADAWDSVVSGKTDSGHMAGESAFNLAIVRVNRIEVVCLHSANIVVGLRTKPMMSFFSDKPEGGE